MQRNARDLWTLGGLSVWELLRRTARESWEDAVFGQGGRMAFYHFLALFPSLLVLLAISTAIPHWGDYVKNALQDLSGQVLPDEAARLVQQVLSELYGRTLSGFHLAAVCAGTAWAALNATWAMVWGLNRAYEVEEDRSWFELAGLIAGLTAAMAIAVCIALFLIFFGGELATHLHRGVKAARVLEWLVLIASLSLWFAVLYRFAPNLRDAQWRWSTPGALFALILWMGATFTARVYFNHINDYSRSYGHLNGVVMLLLWLYVTNGAILMGGEMNSEIEKNAEQGAGGRREERQERRESRQNRKH
ncbi:MAG TPA: YihY/virulence factor BrkB family protein [Bryobacteraceae bacterium]|nr:YihY/virulence factor BrkB family protein [Bryobacteraceae bacterium]